MNWQSIDTAPLKETVLLLGFVMGTRRAFLGELYDKEDFHIAFDDGYHRWDEDTKYPTHWSPMPEAPHGFPYDEEARP